MRVVTLTSCDADWCGVYVDDECVYQTHSFSNISEILDQLQERVQGPWRWEWHSLSEDDELYLNLKGHLPDSLAALKAGEWYGPMTDEDREYARTL